MKQEFFIKNNELIPETGWIERINSFRTNKNDELPDSETKISLEVRRLVDNAIRERVEGLDSIGICFSGGLDSSYIAAICKK